MADPILGNVQLQLRAGLVVRPPSLAEAPTLYWRSASPADAPASRLSSKSVISGDMAVAGTLSTQKGGTALQFNFPGSGTPPEVGSTPTGFLPGKTFVSDSLAAQNIPPQLWTLAGAAQSGSVGAHTGFAIALGVWRPSDGNLVGMIYDGASITGSNWSLSGATGAVGMFAGDEVVVLDGDLLVLEVYQALESGTFGTMANALYEGSGAIVDGQPTVGNPASFIRPTTALVFQ